MTTETFMSVMGFVIGFFCGALFMVMNRSNDNDD